MQASTQQNISFKALLATPDAKATKGFQKAKKTLLDDTENKDILVDLIKDKREVTPYIGKRYTETVQRFRVVARTLLKDISFTEESESASARHLKKAKEAAVKGLTQKLYEQHCPKPEPKPAFSKEELEKASKQINSFLSGIERLLQGFGATNPSKK